MKKISIQSVAVSNLVTGEPVFCEFELCSQTYKTKVFKNDITLDQAFNLGVLNVTDKLTLSFKGKRSGEILATNFISLDQFAAQGSYEHTIIVGEICKVSLQILVSSSGGGIRRSTSLQNIKEKFTRFLQKEKKEEEPEGGGGPAISQITHSHSHMGDLSVEASAPLKEKLKDELPSSVDSTPRRRRKKRTKDETEDSTDIKPRHKREKDLLCKEQKSPMRERRKKKNRIDGSDSEKSERREKSRSNSSSPKNSRQREKSNNSSKKEGESKMKKSKLSDTNETKSEKKTEETAEKKSEPESKVDESKSLESGAEPKRRTVVLQPIGKGKKLFGSPLDEVMAQQKETHPDLDVPIFFQTADKIIREKGFDVQGIFRIRGKLKEVKELKAKIDNGENLDEECCNVHLVATLVKAFLRELPVPILTFENYDAFIAAADYKGEEQIDKLADIMSSLPKENYDLTKFIFSLLHDLSVKAEITQMTSDNLAKVISPNLIWKKELDIMDLSAVQDATKGNAIASVLIDNNSKIFRS